MDLKTPLEALIAIYNLLDGEFEFDALAIFLTLFYPGQLLDSCTPNVVSCTVISALEIY